MATYNTESVSTAMYTPDTVAAPASGYHDVIPICPDFLMGYCSVMMCSFAHPGKNVGNILHPHYNNNVFHATSFTQYLSFGLFLMYPLFL